MTRIISTAVAVPPHKIEQGFAKEFAVKHFGGRLPEIERLSAIFDNAGIDSRYLCEPPEWFSSFKSFGEKNQRYVEWAIKLGTEAVAACIEKAEIEPERVDHIIFVSTTGLATPSIDARIIGSVGLRRDISRLPVWGLGCAGGACGLSLADDYVRAYPESIVLLVAFEACSLTFHHKDYSLANFVASALFGDGAAAVLLGNYGDGPKIVAHKSTIWPQSLDVMGWNIVDEGLQVVFAKEIPKIVADKGKTALIDFVSANNLTLEQIDHFIFHPGGIKVVEAYEKGLKLNNGELRISRDILRRFGNMSSVTVLFVLHETIAGGFKFGKYGLLTSLGPGFSAESLLLKG